MQVMEILRALGENTCLESFAWDGQRSDISRCGRVSMHWSLVENPDGRYFQNVFFCTPNPSARALGSVPRSVGLGCSVRLVRAVGGGQCGLQCTSFHFLVIQFTSLHFISLHFISIHFISFHLIDWLGQSSRSSPSSRSNTSTRANTSIRLGWLIKIVVRMTADGRRRIKVAATNSSKPLANLGGHGIVSACQCKQ